MKVYYMNGAGNDFMVIDARYPEYGPNMVSYMKEQGVQTDKIDCNQFSNGFEPEEEGDETPVMEISIKMNDSFIPEMQKQMNDFFQMLGIPFPDLLKECEDDE